MTTVLPRSRRIASRRRASMPAVGVSCATILNVEQALSQRGSGLSRLAAGDDVGASGSSQLADRRDDRRGAAGKDLADQARFDTFEELINPDPTFHRRQAELLGQRQDRVAGDAFQDGARQL